MEISRNLIIGLTFVLVAICQLISIATCLPTPVLMPVKDYRAGLPEILNDQLRPTGHQSPNVVVRGDPGVENGNTMISTTRTYRWKPTAAPDFELDV